MTIPSYVKAWEKRRKAFEAAREKALARAAASDPQTSMTSPSPSPKIGLRSAPGRQTPTPISASADGSASPQRSDTTRGRPAGQPQTPTAADPQDLDSQTVVPFPVRPLNRHQVPIQALAAVDALTDAATLHKLIKSSRKSRARRKATVGVSLAPLSCYNGEAPVFIDGCLKVGDTIISEREE